MSARDILEALVARLEAYRDHLEEMLEIGHRRLVLQASDLHLLAAEDLASFAAEVEAGRFGLSGRRRTPPKVSLEALERGFFALWDQAEREEALARKLERVGGKVARQAARAPRKSGEATRSYARALKDALERAGRWNEDVRDVLNMGPWL